jgi:hypothetical protein
MRDGKAINGRIRKPVQQFEVVGEVFDGSRWLVSSD